MRIAAAPFALWLIDPERFIPDPLPRIGEHVRRRLGSFLEIADTTDRFKKKQLALSLGR